MKKRMKVFLSAMIVFALLVTSVCNVFANNKEKGKGNSNFRQNYQQQNNSDENSSDNQFTDVGKNFWAYKAIDCLTGLGIIAGFSDKTFKPNATVTRSQFASMLSNALDLTVTSNTQTFADVPPSSWDYKAVEASKSYLTGYRTSNGTLYFYGTRNAVREDMAVALVRALNITLVSENGQLQQVYSDYNEISPALRDYVYTAYKEGIMVGSDGKYKPQSNLTRAEAAALLLKALQKTDKVPVDDGTKIIVDNSKHTDATLNNLIINGVTVTGFAANTLTYNIILPAETTAIPVVAAAVNDTGKATAIVAQAAALPGHATVVVTAENGTTQKIYTINFTVAAVEKHTDATLSNLTISGLALTGFAPSTLTYNVVLLAGTTAVPAVAASVTDTGKAAAVVTQAAGLPGHATVIVTAEDGTTQKTYIVNFTVAAVVKNSDATLSNLAINGVALTGFSTATLTYDVILPAGTTTAPAISVTVNDTGKATAVVTQASSLPWRATAVVTAEDGTTQKTYTINFTVSAS